MTAKLRNTKACETTGDYIHLIRDESVTIRFGTCIGNFFSPSVMHWIEAFDSFEKGTMPFTGNLMEQPSKLLDVMRIIRGHKLRQQEIDHKKQTSKSKQSLRGLRGRQQSHN